MPSEPARDLGRDPEAQLVLVRRDDLRAVLSRAGLAETPLIARLLAAVNGEAATVERRATWVYRKDGPPPPEDYELVNEVRFVGPWTTQETP